MATDLFDFLDAINIPLVMTNSDLALIYANPAAKEILPMKFVRGRTISVEGVLQHEDSISFESLVSECRERGESSGTLKQKGMDKYFKVKAYHLKDCSGEIVFQFEDVSRARLLEEQLFEHIIDVYGQLESQEREIADLKAILIRSKQA